MIAPRPVPSRFLDVKQMRPPNLDYPYFAAAGVVPFEPNASQYSPANASWLADAALLAYAEPAFVRAACETAGFTWGGSFTGTSTAAYLVHGEGFAIAAFRGTDVTGPIAFGRDMANNLRLKLGPWQTIAGGAGAGLVHSGFLGAQGEVWGDLSLELLAHRSAGRQLWLTGHSLGGALSTLAAARLGDVAGLYTYAAPRVGDAQFAESLSAINSARFVHAQDIVPRVPPRHMKYEHVGPRWLIALDGTVGLEAEPMRVDDSTGIEELLTSAAGAMSLHVFDHAPVLYATHLWNALAATQG